MYHNRGHYVIFRVLAILSVCLIASAATPSGGSLPPAKGKYKIGMLLPFSPQSHRNCFIPLAEALADRGHEVVILSPLPPKSKHPNVKEINHGIQFEMSNMFEVRENDPTGGFGFFSYILPKIAREMYDVPIVKEMYEKRKEFDLFLIDELFNEPAYPFLQGTKYVAIAPPGFLAASSAILGNVLNPSYVPGIAVDYQRPYTFLQRVTNLFYHVSFAVYWRHYALFPLVQKELNQRFPDFPPLAEIEKGLSLVLANTHFSLDFPMPILPSQVEIGGMHCHPGKKLPADLKTFIEGAGSDGVIYFSLGTVAKGSTIPEKYKKILIEVFSKLKQRVIWKFEEEFTGLPQNILIKNWLPQQDILAHPKVKLFITHGGLLSMQEAMFHATPLLALPIFGDQERNAQRIKNNGFGSFLLWESMTTESLQSTIKDILTDKKYQTKVDSVSAAFRDQPTPPLEKAVWWTEYVIRHKGAPQLKSPAADISWIEYLMVDVIIAIHLALFTMYWVLKKVFKMVFKMVVGLFSQSNKKQEKKKKRD